MKYAFFIGCNTPARLPQYERSARAVLARFDVDLVDYREFTCCGYPLRNVDQKAFLLSAAGNLALAERDGLPVLVLCKCGFGTFKEAQYRLKADAGLRDEINALLRRQGLFYEGRVEVKHLLSVLTHDVGLEALRKRVAMRIQGLQIAVHYGCHALRPSRITGFDDPVAPSLFDALVQVTGAESVAWGERLDCCGAPLLGIDDRISLDLTQKKVRSARHAGADYLCTACPYCQLQFDRIQGRLVADGRLDRPLPSLLYPQLLGLCMGIQEADLGLTMNFTKSDAIRASLKQE